MLTLNRLTDLLRDTQLFLLFNTIPVFWILLPLCNGDNIIFTCS